MGISAAAATAIGAGISAAGSVAGSAISASSKGGGNASTQQQSQTTDASHTPWGPQGSSISNALTNADQVFDARSAAGPYTGALYTGTNAWQWGAMQQAAEFGSNYGKQAAIRTMGIGDQGDTALGQSVGIAGNLGTNGIGGQNGALTGALQGYATGATPVVNAGLSGALNNSAIAGAQAIGGYNSGLTGVIGSAMSDPTKQLAADAGTYASSGYVQNALDNVNNQIDTTLNETTNPGLNRAAAMNGNINSSRAGMAEAMANRDAALAKGNADSSILNNAYNSGLGVASAQRTAGLNTAASAASAGLTGNSNLAIGAGNQDISAANSAITAANAGLSQETAHQTADASARLGAANALTAGANTAINANGQSIAQATGAANLFDQAGNQYQQNENNQLGAAYQGWQNTNQYQQGVLNDYFANATRPSGFYESSSATQSNGSSAPPSSIGSLIAGGATAPGSQLAPGGLFNSKNKDGTANDAYVGNWFKPTITTGGDPGQASYATGQGLYYAGNDGA